VRRSRSARCRSCLGRIGDLDGRAAKEACGEQNGAEAR